MKKRTPKVHQAVETWYEIHVWIPPGEARGNVPYWIPLRTRDGRPYREASAKLAKALYKVTVKDAPPGKRLKLVQVWANVIEEHNP